MSRQALWIARWELRTTVTRPGFLVATLLLLLLPASSMGLVHTLLSGAPPAEVQQVDVVEAVGGILVPLVGALCLSLALSTGAGYHLHGLSDEKQSRVVEVVLGYVTAEELFTGKLVGISTACLGQFALMALAWGFSVTAFLPELGLGWGTVLWSSAFFLAAYLFCAACMMGAGALSEPRHAHLFGFALHSMVMVVPMMTYMVVHDAPMGTVARVLTLFPATAPPAVLTRLSVGPVPAWELVLSLTGCALATVVTVHLAARLFRASVLLRGQRPRAGQLLRALRA